MAQTYEKTPCPVLYDLRVASRAPAEHIRAWKPPVEGIREVFHAAFADHAYPPHTHDTWTLFVVDAGAVRYDLGRKDHGALPAMVTILPPGVVHDGRSADHDGFRKRVLYVEESVLGEHLVGPAVDRPEITDDVLRRDVSRIHRRLLSADDALEAEVRLASIAERIAFHLGGIRPDLSELASNELADALRAYLDARLFESARLIDAANAIAASPTHLARSFQRAFGIAPHKYVLGRRIDAARSRLLDGYPSAEVAVSVGFYDQAHFIRHFKRLTGVTPGHFARNGPHDELPIDRLDNGAELGTSRIESAQLKQSGA